jgi:hypothetical protein
MDGAIAEFSRGGVSNNEQNMEPHKKWSREHEGVRKAS